MSAVERGKKCEGYGYTKMGAGNKKTKTGNALTHQGLLLTHSGARTRTGILVGVQAGLG